MERYDIIVIGGGPSGAAAAVAAARNKSKVLLIEREGYLGGMATNASIPAFGPYTDGRTNLIGGIGLEIQDELKKLSFDSPFFDYKPDRIKNRDWLPIDAEALKRVLDSIVMNSGCHLLLHTSVIGAECSGGTISSVTIHNKSGIEKAEADYFIDCSGDADVAALSGAGFEYGDDQGRVQAATLCFKIANFHVERFMEYAKEVKEDGNLSVAVNRAKAAVEFPAGEKSVAGIAILANGMAGLNFGHVFDIKPLDQQDLTRAELEARSRLPEFMEFLHRYVPGAENAVLAGSGPNIGIRESRRIIGEYKMTEEDYYNRADFEDSIAYYNYPIDMHAAVPEESEDNHVRYKTSKYRMGECYGIPYRCLLPKELNNLAVAGRTVSSDRAMMSTLRMMPPCFATGQAAGTAAALCKAGAISFKELEVPQLRRLLHQQGVYLKDFRG
ncbi:hypothetical protein HNQ56_001888 [Anaerotaenia torta]|uniref:FAD-dependent oxidoreductase n=1 Tax=Anaerotaenia torta TaxID=433293 RepID=UPI003D2530C5